MLATIPGFAQLANESYIRVGAQAPNARIVTSTFIANGSITRNNSPWYDICLFTPRNCYFGKTIRVPEYSNIYIGGCIGDCNQFVSGSFTINGKTYPTVYYTGNWNFSVANVFIPKFIKRKGSVFLHTPFTLFGSLQACLVSVTSNPCPADKVLYNGGFSGGGMMTMKSEIINWEPPFPYLQQRSFDYDFDYTSPLTADEAKSLLESTSN